MINTIIITEASQEITLRVNIVNTVTFPVLNLIIRNNCAVLSDDKTAPLTYSLALLVIGSDNHNSLAVLLENLISIGK